MFVTSMYLLTHFTTNAFDFLSDLVTAPYESFGFNTRFTRNIASKCFRYFALILKLHQHVYLCTVPKRIVYKFEMSIRDSVIREVALKI